MGQLLFGCLEVGRVWTSGLSCEPPGPLPAQRTVRGGCAGASMRLNRIYETGVRQFYVSGSTGQMSHRR